MKYFIVNLHSKPSIVKVSYERWRSLLDEYGGKNPEENVLVLSPYPFTSSVKCAMLTDDLLLIKWNK